MRMIDIIGSRFHRWTVISRATNTRQGQAMWLCRCDCGTERKLKSIVIRRGISQSCGCLKSELMIARNTTHGQTESPTYGSWRAMLSRCSNPNDKSFKDYGGRGITVCDQWRNSFETFFADMGEKPEGMSIERKDTNWNYESGNCVWATATTQARNKRTSRLLTHNGVTRTTAEWSEVTGISQATISDRLNSGGWSVEQTLAVDPAAYRETAMRKAAQHKITPTRD